MKLLVGCLAASLTLLCTLAAQDMTTIDAAKDNTLFEDTQGSVSNGAGPGMFVGKNNQGSLRRGVIAFDVAGSVPAGVAIDSVSLALFMDQTTSGPHNVSLHRSVAEWGEGTSNSGGGTGAASTPDDATWIHTFYDSAFWTAAGGDFAAPVSASLSVDGVGMYHFSSSALAEDVQSWLDAPAENHGWFLIGNEAVNQSAKRFATKEHGTLSNRPVLTVYWSGTVSVPEAGNANPAEFSLDTNYPNPFNPGTTIRYSLPERLHVQLKVFTITGQEVATLVDGLQDAGTRVARWDATGMASGAYLYTIRAGEFIRTRPMMFMK